jgi:hypothetical protein
MSELIARLEAATGPDRGLDAAIHDVVSDAELTSCLLPAYTASLDAAVALVPDGFHWAIRATPIEDGPPLIEASVDWAPHPSETGATPALALCIAALRARS